MLRTYKLQIIFNEIIDFCSHDACVVCACVCVFFQNLVSGVGTRAYEAGCVRLQITTRTTEQTDHRPSVVRTLLIEHCAEYAQIICFV